MKNQIKLQLMLCVVVLSATGCSKVFTKRGFKKNKTEIVQQEVPREEAQLTVKNDTIVEKELYIVEAEQKDTVMQNVVEIPEEEEGYEAISFSEEQSESIVLPEYKNMDINDLSLLLTEMQDDFHYPTDTVSYVTSPYGWRWRRMHAGIDLKVQTGDNLYATFSGVVRVAKYYGGYGYCVVIRHYNGLETLYGHCSKILVDVNDEVKAGDVIALGGNTGRSTGSHLHFEVRVAGNYINPNLVIDTKNHGLQDKNLYITRRSNRIFASNNDSAEEREADIVQALSIKYYYVRSGDVLSRIAANNRTTVATICRLNNISSRSTLRIGQRLIVRDGIRPTTSSTKHQTSLASNDTAPTTSKSSATSTYTVRRGDTLSKIAHNSGTSVSTICQLNSITTRTTLQIGQKLRINGVAGGGSTGGTTASRYYTVRSGDTLSGIAQRNGTSVKTICNLNNISTRTTLRIGQRLALNGGGSGSVSKGRGGVYTVRSGDTLSGIAQRNGTSVKAICNLNNISTRTTLRIGQRLMI